jgi:hypothetical protein
MGKTLKEKLLDIKKEQEIGYVNFYNTGKIDTDTNGYGKRIKTFKSSEYEDLIKEVLYKAAESYAYSVTYDSIELFLSVGLVFNKSDVNDDNTIKENALPYKNTVRFYTGSVNSYMNDKQVNFADYYRYGVGYQGYVDYNQLVESIEKEGISFKGPRTFKELSEKILSGEKFDISLYADLVDKKGPRKVLK